VPDVITTQEAADRSPSRPTPPAAPTASTAAATTGVTRLADLTTLRVGGPARRLVVATTTDAVIDAVQQVDASGEPLLVLGGGSNLVVADDGFDGTVVQVATRGSTLEAADYCGGVALRVAAGEPWDGVVDQAVGRGWSGIEALSGIPGSAGATPVQNVGAYGQEISEVVFTVRTWDRQENRVRTVAGSDAGFAYRHSRFKEERFRGGPRYVVLEVVLQLPINDISGPIRYTELASRLGVKTGGRAPLAAVRHAVLELRRAKGMVLDPDDHDTWSAGSFFTNPILPADDAAGLPEGAPRWPAGQGKVKTSAAWLIEHSGFGKGWGLQVANGGPPVTLSTRHTLAITNRGSATAADVVALARAVRDGVRERFGVELAAEPELVGVDL
jgi:UDP-N-acetylmuramate dehydrogenase